MSKKKLEFNVPPPAHYLKKVRKSVRRHLVEATAEGMKDIATHFRSKKNGGWPLALSIYQEGILSQVLGAGYSWHLISSLVHAGYEVDIKDGEWMISKKARK